jgi:hypothetical protein
MIRVFLILAAVLCLVTTCCDDCPDCPVCPEPEPEEHLFYIAPKQGNMVKIFSVEREAFIDSLVVDSIASNSIMRIHVISDDSLLAVTAGSKTYIVDLKTKGIIDSFGSRALMFSRNSRFYFDGNSLYLYPEHTLIYTDPESGGFGRFCNQSEILTYQYYVTPRDPIELGIYNILGGSFNHAIKTWHGHGVTFFASQAVGSLQKVFIDAATYCALGVCDFDSDTLRMLKYLPYGGGATLVVSPDDKYVFFTDYGPTPFGYGPSGHIFVWDAETEDSVAAIAYPFTWNEQFNMLVMSYDGKYLIARPFNEMNEFTTFCLIDAQNHEVIGTYDCGFLTGNVTAKYCIRDMLTY